MTDNREAFVTVLKAAARLLTNEREYDAAEACRRLADRFAGP